MTLIKAEFFLADAEAQFRWYLARAGLGVADRYLAAVNETLLRLARHPQTGRLRRFRTPALRGFRSQIVVRPYNRHIVFYQIFGECLHARRVMDGSRDLARRLAQSPTAGD